MNQLHWQNNRNTYNYRLLFAHLDNRQLRHVEVSGDVRADHRFKVLGCVFRERFWDINAGIVDEEINALEVPHSRISNPGSGLLLPMSPSARTRSAEGFKSFDLLIVRELATTRYRRSSSARAMPNPMPLDAPVTMATGCLLLFALIAFFPFGLIIRPL